MDSSVDLYAPYYKVYQIYCMCYLTHCAQFRQTDKQPLIEQYYRYNQQSGVLAITCSNMIFQSSYEQNLFIVYQYLT